MMFRRPLVTVITATYNIVSGGRSDSIAKCIESVHMQDYDSIEHIVIDGASNDGTLNLLKKYVDDNLIHVFSEKDNGIYDAFNKGVVKAKGEYVVFLNSDDYFIDRSFISKSIRKLLINNSDFSYANAVVVRNNLKDVWPGRIDEYLMGRLPCHQTILMKKTLIETMGFFDLNNYGIADNLLVIKAIKSGASSVYIDTEAVCFDGGGFSSNLSIQAKEQFLSNIVELFPELTKDEYELFYGKINLQKINENVFYEIACKLNDSEAKERLLRLYLKENIVNDTVMKKLNVEIKNCENKRVTPKRLLFIDHFFHCKTNSTKFLIDIFEKEFEVDKFYYNPYDVSKNAYDSLSGKTYNVVVLFQIMPSILELQKYIDYENIVFFPMYDAIPSLDDPIWKEYKNCCIINFSITLHDLCSKRGFLSYNIKYFPKPPKIEDLGDKRSVFFWQRRPEIDTYLFDKVVGFERINKLYLHDVPDPQLVIKEPCKNWLKKIEYSHWFASKYDMERHMQKCAIYFAPRQYEGIGMSFLDAMALGRCVIVPNNPTMNEYVIDGETGYLYDVNKPSYVELENIDLIQKNCRMFMEKGYKQWEKEKWNINKWIRSYPNRNSFTEYNTCNSMFIISAYKQILGRAPDESGYNTFKKALDGNKISKAGLLVELYWSDEFQKMNFKKKDVYDLLNKITDVCIKDITKYDNEKFVFASYVLILKRLPDYYGNQYFLNCLMKGSMSKEDIIYALYKSDEGRKVNVRIREMGKFLIKRKIKQAVYRLPIFKQLKNINDNIYRLNYLLRMMGSRNFEKIKQVELKMTEVESMINKREGFFKL